MSSEAARQHLLNYHGSLDAIAYMMAWESYSPDYATNPKVLVTGNSSGPSGDNPLFEVLHPEREDAEFIAHARTDIPALLSALDAERAKNTEALAVLNELTDPDPCDWDHNHSCQAHGFYYIPQGEMCPNEQARILGGTD